MGDVQLRITTLLRIQQPGSVGNDFTRTVAQLSRSMSSKDVFTHARMLVICFKIASYVLCKFYDSTTFALYELVCLFILV